MTLTFSMVVCSYQGGRNGVRIPQTRTEMRVNTAQNNMRKPQNALKLPENFLILETTWFCKTAIPQLQIKLAQNGTKNRAKPHHRKPLRSTPYTHQACYPF